MDALHLDNRTIVFVASAIAFLMAQVMVLLSLALKRHRGPGFWAAGACGLAVCTLLISLQESLPPWYGIVLGNTGLMVSLCLVCHGLVVFLERPPRLTVYVATCLATLLGFAYFSLIQPDFTGRALNFSLTYGYLSADMAWVLYRHQHDRREPSYLFVLLAFLIPVLLNVARVIVLLSTPRPPQSLMQAGGLGTLILLIYMLNAFILFVSLIMLATSRFARELEQANRALELLSNQDGLTGLFNRRYLDAHLENEFQRAARERSPLGAILIDIDHFKAFNDAHGHQAGDECLQQVARAIHLATRRPGDLAARYGGEEFAVILPGSDLAGAAALAGTIRRRVEELEHGPSGGRVTISLGVTSVVPRAGARAAEVMAMADRALYEAKRAGRNQVVACDAGGTLRTADPLRPPAA